MNRRDVIALLGGAALWPLPARAQPRDRVRRIGLLQGVIGEELQARKAALLQALQQLGWSEGHNLTFEHRFGSGTADTIRKQAAELIALEPQVVVSAGSATTEALRTVTRSVPIVFTIVPDPVGAGFVKSLSRPGGNMTGFMQAEYNLSGKWLELLKQIAPTMTRAAVLRDATTTAGIGQFAVIQSVAPSLAVDVVPIDVRDPGEIERELADFARIPNGGLILTSTPLGVMHRDLVIALAARLRLPALYSNRSPVEVGGLLSYGANFLDSYRLAAGYVDRILRGEKAADLPVQAPTKYELIINLRTARALGIEVPPTLLARADEVIE